MRLGVILEDNIAELPLPLTIENARNKIRDFNSSKEQWIIVLDDDPTGCQTVYNVPILTCWDRDTLKRTIANHYFFFILTNTRACSGEEACRTNKEIIERIVTIIPKEALKIISRSDSTLRGHFAGEVGALVKLAGPFDGVIVMPYFKEGLRFTIDDTHYIKEGESLIPVHLTEFALDKTFGYKHSHLPSWIEEQTKGHWKKENVVCISLKEIRIGGVEAVYQKLIAISHSTPVIFNALCDGDVEVAVLAICKAEQGGKRFLYRTAASFVKIRAGIADAPFYQVTSKFKKGLVIVGSHVAKTTEQLKPLLTEPSIQKIEILLQKVFSGQRDGYLQNVLLLIKNALLNNESVLIYTERKYALTNHTDKLGSGMAISDFLSELVFKLDVAPDFIIVKGGITSHDIAVKGLLIKDALVLGQIAPGVPVWQSSATSKFGSIYYVVFPGNVGDTDTLKNVFLKFIN